MHLWSAQLNWLWLKRGDSAWLDATFTKWKVFILTFIDSSVGYSSSGMVQLDGVIMTHHSWSSVNLIYYRHESGIKKEEKKESVNEFLINWSEFTEEKFQKFSEKKMKEKRTKSKPNKVGGKKDVAKNPKKNPQKIQIHTHTYTRRNERKLFDAGVHKLWNESSLSRRTSKWRMNSTERRSTRFEKRKRKKKNGNNCDPNKSSVIKCRKESGPN